MDVVALRSLSAKSSDPLALDDDEPLDGEDGPKAAQWEHEDLAQVRVKVFRGQYAYVSRQRQGQSL